MSDSLTAKGLLCENGFTCVLCRGSDVITSSTAGISPVLDLIHDGCDLRGYSIADKIVGKAAAMLFVYAGIKTVHAQVLSETGAEILSKYGIDFTYDTITEYIINRRGTGMCPMEDAVKDINEPEAAYKAIYERREQLRKENAK